MKGLTLILILGAALAGVGAHFLLRDGGRPGELSVGKITSDWPEHVAANGVVEGARPETALRPEVVGTITAIPFRENHSVTKGTLLAELQNEMQKQQVALAEAEVNIAKATLDRLIHGERAERRKALAALEKSKQALCDQAKGDHERNRGLLSSRAISQEKYDADYFRMLQTQADFESARAERQLAEAEAQTDEVKAAQARVAAAEARRKLAEAELAKTYVLAPCDGQILQVYAEPGELAGPTTVQPLLILADLSKRRVRAFIEELDSTRVKVGQSAVVTADALPCRELTGSVSVVVPRMGKRSPQTDTPGEYKDLYFREILIDLENADDLPPNLRVKTIIRTKSDGVAP
jgi:multidrug resistance efflux pump